MKFGVITFPGSNCDHDMIYVLESKLGQEVVNIWHKDADLQGADVIVLPGGFSFGDYLRSGAIARFTNIMPKVMEHAEKGGVVIGICNGFQVLCEAGLLPGALLHNNTQKFICKNIYIKAKSKNTKLTNYSEPEKALKIPIAHGEGRYYASQESLEDLQKNDQILFQYCDENGTVNDKANPNGSLLNIAGICNKNRNVFGMMPHPERAADDELRNEDGALLFKSLIEFGIN
ncbi:MAG: phosphoribosylformylglycinamidine synthase subunit PurQ [Flavobacteriales bacterium]|nr:phosphoribosylformylglycinamidine synthase subunit PurQ [Flavobacteriales bacterium]